MDDRKIKILNAIIDSYINIPNPVGSRKISKEFDLGISSATIRNEMSDLEDLGYLNKPHTSAGRIPSDKAYRFYVNELLNSVSDYSDEGSKEVRSLISSDIYEVDHILENAAKVLADKTNYTSYIISNKRKGQNINSIQLISLSDTVILALLIGNRGTVEKTVIRLEKEISSGDLEKLNNKLNESLTGIDFSEAYKIKLKLSGDMIQYRDLISRIIELAGNFGNNADSYDIYSNGLTNLFRHEEFQDLVIAKDIINFLEDKDNIVELLNQRSLDEELDVVIGSENIHDIMKNNSLIISNYFLNNDNMGKIAIIGPVRMDYINLIKSIRIFSHTLTNIIDEIMWEK